MFQLCNRFCLLDQIHDHCECYHPSYLNDAAVGELCNQNMTHEHNLCYMKVLYSLEIGKIKCNCSNACTDVTYDVGVSTSKWPSFVYKVTIFILCIYRSFMLDFKEQAKEKYVMRLSNGSCKSSNFISSSAKSLDEVASDNLLKLNIYFGSKSVTTVTEIATYPSVSRELDLINHPTLMDG